jgi:hypothetical protein
VAEHDHLDGQVGAVTPCETEELESPEEHGKGKRWPRTILAASAVLRGLPVSTLDEFSAPTRSGRFGSKPCRSALLSL